jgi:hypothetical protein
LYHEFDNYGCISGRPKGRGVQMLNLPRSQKPEYWAELIHSAPELLFGICEQPPARLKEGVRGMVKAPEGKHLVWVDLSQIEARLTFWLAGEPRLNEIFGEGRDPYCEYGEQMWGHKITKADLLKRTAAKSTVLGMGFAGGIGAAQRSAEAYDLDLNILADVILKTATPDELSTAHYCYHEIYLKGKEENDEPEEKILTEREGFAADVMKQRYRKDFPRIAAYWDELWEAFMNGGQAGKLLFEVRGNLRIMTLPSGRQLFYHDLQQRRDKATYQAREKRKKMWKGVLIENGAQGGNHDVSAGKMLTANREIAPVVYQCYDMFMVECGTNQVDEVKRQIAELCILPVAGYEGLPLAFEINDGVRYGK